jgi:hypothetical protein
LSQQQYPRIAGDVASIKTRLYAALFTDWKIKPSLGTFCHGEASLYFCFSKLNYKGIKGFAIFIRAIFGLVSVGHVLGFSNASNTHKPLQN